MTFPLGTVLNPIENHPNITQPASPLATLVGDNLDTFACDLDKQNIKEKYKLMGASCGSLIINICRSITKLEFILVAYIFFS